VPWRDLCIHRTEGQVGHRCSKEFLVPTRQEAEWVAHPVWTQWLKRKIPAKAQSAVTKPQNESSSLWILQILHSKPLSNKIMWWLWIYTVWQTCSSTVYTSTSSNMCISSSCITLSSCFYVIYSIDRACSFVQNIYMLMAHFTRLNSHTPFNL
jgi:hypothetical protein